MKSALRSVLVAIIGAVSLSAHPHPDAAPFGERVGLQLYSLRGSFLKDPFAAMDLVASYGITEVETAGTARMTAAQFAAELASRGLMPVSAHVGYDALVKDFDAVLAEVQAIGARNAVIAWIPHEGSYDETENERAIAHFNEWGPKFAQAGIRFGYHPHGYEFGGGKAEGDTLFDRMLKATADRNVNFELDVFWAVHGGADPIALMTTYPDRWLALHVKDIRRGAPTGLTSGHAPAEDNVIIGTGAIDWPTVLGKAREIGVRHYFIEDETPDPLANIPPSLDYLRKLDI